MEMEKQMVHVQAQVDRMATLIEFEREVDNGDDILMGEERMGARQLFDQEEIQMMTQMPIKRTDISMLVEKYESEHQYLESLNLRKNPLERLEFNYDLLQSATQQREYLDAFSSNFLRFVNQLLTLADYQRTKEKVHLQQIQYLADQNQILFEENCSLQKQITILNQSSQASLNPPQPVLAAKEQKKIIKDVCLLHRQKLEILKSQILQTENEAIPLGKLTLPLEDQKLYALVNGNFDIIDSIQGVIKQRIDHLQTSEEKIKARLATTLSNYNVFKSVFDNITMKQLPRCRQMMNIALDYVKSTMEKERKTLEEVINQNGGQDKLKISILNIIPCYEQMIGKIDNIIIQL